MPTPTGSSLRHPVRQTRDLVNFEFNKFATTSVCSLYRSIPPKGRFAQAFRWGIKLAILLKTSTLKKKKKKFIKSKQNSLEQYWPMCKPALKCLFQGKVMNEKSGSFEQLTLNIQHYCVHLQVSHKKNNLCVKT